MMRPLDGVRLASAKLRAHRVRTGIITTIVALLFAGIVLVLAMVAGAAKSLESFGKEGLGSRYIVQATPIVDYQVVYSGNAAIMTKLSDETTRLKAAKKAEAKKLGIDYDAANDQTLPTLEQSEGGVTKIKVPNFSSDFTKQAITEHMNSIPHVAYADFSKAAEAAGAKAVYKSTSAGQQAYSQQQTSVSAIVDGKEQAGEAASQVSAAKGVAQLSQGNWRFFDSDLLQPFLLPGQDLSVAADGSIPVVAPVSAAETFLKKTAVSSTATPEKQIEHIETIRSSIAGKTAQLCYRNTSSAELLATAKTQQEDMRRNKSKAGYTAPALQYTVPSEPCGAVTVKKDTRTSEEKKQANNELSFKKQFEGYEEPVQGIITIRFVGLVPDTTYAMGFSVKDILKSMLQSSLGEGWFSPIAAVPQGSLAGQIAQTYDGGSSATRTYYAEFADYKSAKDFTKMHTCDVTLTMKEMMSYSVDNPDPRVTKCYAAGKYFDISAFGNNASAIADLKSIVWKVMRVVAPMVLFIAALVLMGIVGKIIADSRRETAVFRALGATRSSIAQVYLTYSLFIAVIILLIAGGLGGLGAYLLSEHLSPSLSVTAVLAYNAQDLHKQFTLFGIDPLYVITVAGLIITATLLSTIIPLLANVRRNPIRDMRDE